MFTERTNRAGFVPWSSEGKHGTQQEAGSSGKQKPARKNMLAETEHKRSGKKGVPARRVDASVSASSSSNKQHEETRTNTKSFPHLNTKRLPESKASTPQTTSTPHDRAEHTSNSLVKDMHTSSDTMKGKRNSGVSAFNSWLDLYHKPSRTLATTLARHHEGSRGRTHNLHGGEFKAKDQKFYKQYSDFLNKDHPVGHTLRGTGIHPDSYHPHPTSASKGSDFSKWLETDDRNVKTKERENERENERERRMLAEQKLKILRGFTSTGALALILLSTSAIGKEYDAIQNAQKARARAQLGLKHMQAAVNQVEMLGWNCRRLRSDAGAEEEERVIHPGRLVP
ncbi:hypothetical protein GUITHDRAFT_115196 [Guillardia theta CCMP2712]|uniref:Uncharacterized protein n=1 Tax=Guillardia theta (strain CCMP2712) TaxID=905079 RepID=L1IS47_GUITC|nr:hypothetical protein GUITHDRAFT_115196 [Guillardia theta CCMP2712]EKX38650.1 hypothetical protein GUITHDRAFT_115196 [Guillardia theta CCMP2712]|eukprot:XP_005825630.1 hypothetical protein GUITHDRAFT_115196 [Guillardia theta CCMP2712]